MDSFGFKQDFSHTYSIPELALKNLGFKGRGGCWGSRFVV